MKKAAEKSAVRWSCVIFAALFFFLAAFSWSLWHTQDANGLDVNTKERRKTLVSNLYEERVQTLSDSVLQPNLKSVLFDEEEDKIEYPDEINATKTNFRFKTEIEAQEKDGKIAKINISTMTKNEETWYEESKTKTVQVIGSSAGESQTVEVTVRCALAKSMEKHDQFWRLLLLVHIGSAYKDFFWMGGIVFGTLALLCCLIALRGAVREASRVKGAQRMFNALPPDLYVCCVLPALVIAYRLLLGVIEEGKVLDNYLKNGSGEYRFMLRPFCMTVIFVLILVFLVLFVYSLRRGGVRCIFAFWRFEKIPFPRRTVFYLAAMQVIKATSIALYVAVSIYLGLKTYLHWVILFLLLEKLVTLPVLFRTLRQLRALMDKTAQFVEGDLSGKASDERDYATLRMHGADVDTVVQRIIESADEYIQSSNFKAELITNLSHDIKTPLTSIISYANLLEREDLTPEERVKYLEVLHRQSGRLQKLVDDLSEVSDAASGNVPVELTMVDLCSVVQQAVSSFEERLLRQNITIRFSLPKTPVFVMADPRLLQRVTDNLMNNICKYTRFGTEVQIAVVNSKYRVAAVFRNLSDRPMKLTGEELMGRFVREEEESHREGSGLGLSIAQSLMHLQGGKLWLHVKDDVFTSQILFRKT